MGGSQTSWRRGVAAALTSSVTLLLVGCGSPGRDTLVMADGFDLPGPSASTLHIDSAGRFWVGRSGEIVRIDTDGSRRVHYPTREIDASEYLGAAGSQLYFRTSGSLLSIDLAADSGVLRRPGHAEAAAVDPRGHVVLRTEDAGTVVAHEANGLDPVWGWGAVGAASRALAISPQGDRVYQALAEGESSGSATLLVRDLFTGRILRSIELAEPLQAIVLDSDGDLYAAGWAEGGEGAITKIGWEDGELRSSWRRPFRDLGVDPPVRIAYSPASRTLAVLAVNEEAGLHVLNGETGQTMDRIRGSTRDVAFDPGGSIYLLFPDAIRRLEKR